MKNFIIAFLVTFCLVSCKKENNSTNAIQDEVKIDSSKAKKIQIKESSLFVDDWAEIANLESEIKLLLTKSLKSEKDIELLKTRITDLKESIPEKFKTPAIHARIKVLETETMMLERYLKDGVVEKAAKQLEGIFVSYNTFVGQIEAFVIKQRDYEKYK